MAGKDLEKTAPAGAMTRPDFIPRSAVGTEHLTRDDIRLPRLALAQGLSHQVQLGDPLFIKGLSVGEMFNDLTQEVYGQGPMEFFIVRADPPRWVEFYPRDEGGGVKDLNVPHGDPRTSFGEDGEKPIATQFYDYIIVLWPSKVLVALSMKSASLKVARSLNGLVAIRNADLYAGKYTVQAAMEKNAKGTFAQYVVQNAGWVDTPENLKYLKGLFNGLKDKRLVIEREPGDDTPVETVTGEEVTF